MRFVYDKEETQALPYMKIMAFFLDVHGKLPALEETLDGSGEGIISLSTAK